MTPPNEREEDDPEESLDLEDDEPSHGSGGGQLSDSTGSEPNEHFEPEDDDKEPGDYEADGPEEYGMDPDYE